MGLFVLFMVCLFLPLMIHYVAQAVRSYAAEQPTVYIDIIPDYTYEDIKRDAINRAANGDAAARNWVMKHVYDEQAKPVASKTVLTSQNIIDDAVSALMALGTKKAEAKSKVYAVVNNRTFHSVQSLLNEVFKK